MNQSIVPRKPLWVEIFRPVFCKPCLMKNSSSFLRIESPEKKDGFPISTVEKPGGSTWKLLRWVNLNHHVIRCSDQQGAAGPALLGADTGGRTVCFFFRMETMGGRDVDSWLLGSFKMFYCKHLVSWFPAWGDDPIHVFILFFDIYVYIHVMYKKSLQPPRPCRYALCYSVQRIECWCWKPLNETLCSLSSELLLKLAQIWYCCAMTITSTHTYTSWEGSCAPQGVHFCLPTRWIYHICSI